MNFIKYTLLAFTTIALFSCGGGGDCDVADIEVTIGECSCADSYALTLDFLYSDAPDPYFSVYARNNKLVGHYKLTDLPVTIDKFELSGSTEDYIKVCLDDEKECCEEFEFIAPNCEPEVGDCEVFDINVDFIECLSEEKYKIKLDFEVVDAGNEFFDVFIRNGEHFGYYPIKDLPVFIDNFSPSGKDYDFIKVCVNDNEYCCAETEFMTPVCDDACSIFDLKVEQGECTSDETYKLFLDFEYSNPSHTNFEVFVRNNVRIGNFPLTALPLTIEDFALSGKDYDYIKVCMSDDPDCCKEIEFMSPECSNTNECEIKAINVEVGACTSDNTYNLFIDFEYKSPGNESFDVFVRNNVFIGNYPLADLPLKIEDFELSGKDYEFIKICINDKPDCCKEIEFMAPDCSNTDECVIKVIEVDTGVCTSDSTYNLFVDFDYKNPGNDYFDLFVRNNELIGSYLLSELPLKIEDFEMSGKDYDLIKICINDKPDCCKAIEFMPPDC